MCIFFVYAAFTLTVRSLIDLTNYLFTIPEVSFFLTEHINQDPLEKFFGMQRQRGGVHDNQEFEKNTQALRCVVGCTTIRNLKKTRRHCDAILPRQQRPTGHS